MPARCARIVEISFVYPLCCCPAIATQILLRVGTVPRSRALNGLAIGSAADRRGRRDDRRAGTSPCLRVTGSAFDPFVKGKKTALNSAPGSRLGIAHFFPARHAEICSMIWNV